MRFFLLLVALNLALVQAAALQPDGGEAVLDRVATLEKKVDQLMAATESSKELSHSTPDSNIADPNEQLNSAFPRYRKHYGGGCGCQYYQYSCPGEGSKGASMNYICENSRPCSSFSNKFCNNEKWLCNNGYYYECSN
jgi:hypothetical protein